MNFHVIAQTIKLTDFYRNSETHQLNSYSECAGLQTGVRLPGKMNCLILYANDQIKYLYSSEREEENCEMSEVNWESSNR